MNIARTVLPEIPYPQTLDVVTNNPLLQMQITMHYVDIAWKGNKAYHLIYIYIYTYYYIQPKQRNALVCWQLHIATFKTL